VFTRHRFDAIIHFAGLKAVGESVKKAHRVLRQQRSGHTGALPRDDGGGVGVARVLVIGDGVRQRSSVPIREDAPLGPTNPYGHSKLMVERILGDLVTSIRPLAHRFAAILQPRGRDPTD